MFDSLKRKKVKIVEKYVICLCLSLAIIIAGAVMAIVKGTNYGIDFTGGIKISVDAYTDVDNFDGADFDKTITEWLTSKTVTENGASVNKPQYKISGKPAINGSNYVYTLEISYTKADGTVVDNMLTTKADDGKDLVEVENSYIREHLNTYLNEYYQSKYGSDITKKDIVNPNFVGNESMKYILRSAIIAIAVAIVVILIYIAIRFTLISGVAAILALVHDVAVMFALTTIFQIPVNTTFIAAIITIIGYSINATIVVFDKVRELEKRPSYAEVTDKEIANEAIVSTLGRSILTTLTTLVMIAALAIFGTQSIREFALPIIFGLLAGAYSSVLLSASTWVYLRKLFKQADKRPKAKVKAIKTAKPAEEVQVETETENA